MKAYRSVIPLIVLASLFAGLFAKIPQRSLAYSNAQSAAPAPVGQTGTDWTMTFDDEFDGTALNRTVWRSDYFPNGGDGQMQQYVSDNSHNNYLVQNGELQIIARKETLNGQPYTSGIIHTKSRFLQKYGFFEIRARVPYGKGFWPAFWLLPDQDNWIPEIDVTEILGHEPANTYMTFHWLNGSGSSQTQSLYSGPDFSAGMHTFAIDWEPSALVWYVDGVERKRLTDSSIIPNMPLYVIANMGVGGNWPGAPDSTTVFPSSFSIDYIRVWQKTGSGTPTDASNPTMTPTRAPATATRAATSAPDLTGNLIQNKSFEDPAASPWNSPWGYRNDLGATFSQDTSTAANNSAASLKASLPSSSTQPWVVSVNQGNKTLNTGQSYTLSFWARASATRPIRAVVQLQDSPYTAFTNETANLTSSWAKYTYTFTAPASTSAAMVNFNLADASGSVWIDEVALCQVGQACAGTATPTATAAPTRAASPTAPAPSSTPVQTATLKPTDVPPTAVPPTATAAAPTATAVPPMPATATPTLQSATDTTAPKVSITNPSNNSQIRRHSKVTIAASASDNAGISKVEFIVNGQLLCTDTTAPYSCQWLTPNTQGESYSIVARAFDLSQNNASATITVKTLK